jgi:hypothetical protein
VSSDDILMLICEAPTICACYSLELARNVGLGVSLDNTQDWKGIWDKEGVLNVMKACITNDDTVESSTGVTLLYSYSCFTSVFRHERSVRC